VTTSAEPLHRTSADLLSEAVHQNAGLSVTGFLERTFTFAFRSMVYPQIWEDPRVDLEAMEIDSTSRIVTIASGGCNVMNYLIADPACIYAVDLNKTHIALMNLKLAAASHLPNHATFFRFFGGGADWRNTRLYDDVLASYLDADTRAYWESRDLVGRRIISRFSRNFYRYGLLGRFVGFGHFAARMLGTDPAVIMSAKTREEQREIFETKLKTLFNKRIVKWITSKRASLFGLGIPPAQYDALCDQGARPMHEILSERVERLATGFDLNDNYFAWQAFARHYPASGEGPCPPYLDKANFAALRSRVGRVTILNDNFIHVLARQPAESLDRYVLLDAQDWMDDDTLNALWREITRTSAPGARVIFRTAGEKTILPGRVLPVTLSSWRYQEARSAELHAKDRSAIYGGFHLYVMEA
jgi:S-adenosylmethionine-diacylglycerol 3-amino-3-carboxypropyl transferase